MTERYVLDTSAILATWQNEDGSDDVKDLVNKATSGEIELFLSFMTFFEAYYKVKKKEGESRAIDIYYWLIWLIPPQTERVNLEEDILIKAGDMKAKYKVSAVDAWILATALFKDAALVHKDKEFDRIKDLPISIIKIPRNLEGREKV